MDPFLLERHRMVDEQIAARGIVAPAVLEALREVPRERFVAAQSVAFAYEDRPLPIGEGQTISQPYIVALMTEAAEVGPQDRVLEVGTGSGYQAAVLARLAARVFTIERHLGLAQQAERSFAELGQDTIRVMVGDGTLGWDTEAPFDAIVVTAGGPEEVPQPLLDQLAPGGRLVIPVGATREGQELVRIRRSADGTSLVREELGPVRFVPLIGEAGWAPGGGPPESRPTAAPSATVPGSGAGRCTTGLPGRLVDSALPFDDVRDVALDDLLVRIGDARLVLIGEATHGTSEFYALRDRITRALIERRGFDFVAVEADWPDAAEIDAFVRHHPAARSHHKPFQRFPSWMWANHEVLDFVHWLRAWNDTIRGAEPHRMVGFHGLDLYSMYTSMDAVVRYLDDVDPDAARIARMRYACLAPWQEDPVMYGGDAVRGVMQDCEEEVVAVLDELLERRVQYSRADGHRFADALANARLARSAEAYYRAMYRGHVTSWNLRDRHMFDTLDLLLGLYGPESRGVVWAHNSHLGDARATAMGERGELNVGQLAREAFGSMAYLIGFGTHTGTVAAASEWGGEMEVKDVTPSHPASYEHLAWRGGVPNFFLPLRHAPDRGLMRELRERRLERAIGVIYRPETELQSHYFTAALPRQFDEWIWIEQTRAVSPITLTQRERWIEEGVPETFPFGV